MRTGLLALLLAAAAPQEAPQEASQWKSIEPGLTLGFPADHGAHPAYQTEWWYLTGQLEDESGARFGFQFTVFRRGLQPGAPNADESPLRARQVFAGHLALTDVARAETRVAERLQRNSPLAHAAEGELEVVLEDWSLWRGVRDELTLVAADPERAFGFEFALRPAKPLVLHGQGGYSHKGGAPGNAAAYVSWTRLALEGTLALDGTERIVRGTAWFDHEFGSSVLPEGVDGWDWFGLQLDEPDGRELMLFILRDARGEPLEASAATLVERDGTARVLGRADFTLATGTPGPDTSWTSPISGATYPARWAIAVPSVALQLEITPLVSDCELVSRATAISYWEGPVAVTGSATGRGYAELTGYAGSLSGRF
ncbi:MAG: carotenoid 1,2-hydratase [Planctomycetes bacterium]|nr:carotenoid 1,2-hydratase [Planctomycetota bacterium]